MIDTEHMFAHAKNAIQDRRPRLRFAGWLVIAAVAISGCGGTPLEAQERIGDAFAATSACEEPGVNPIDDSSRRRVRAAIDAYSEYPDGRYEDKEITNDPASFREVMRELQARLDVCDDDLAAEVGDALLK